MWLFYFLLPCSWVTPLSGAGVFDGIAMCGLFSLLLTFFQSFDYKYIIYYLFITLLKQFITFDIIIPEKLY